MDFNKMGNINFHPLVSMTPSKMSLIVFLFSCQKLKIESKYVGTGMNNAASKAAGSFMQSEK